MLRYILQKITLTLKDGSRRRTPGGVYIQLMKQQPEFTPEVRKIIFKEDIEQKNAERNEQRKK